MTVAADLESSPPDTPDPLAVRRRLHAYATAVERRELRESMRALDAVGALAPEQRHVVVEMADAIAAELLTPADAALCGDAPEIDRVRAVGRLFAAE